ncbi:MAG: signal peptidase I [Legionellales bacterium]|nr:signal peptidase I [Legionellales bacterium]OUX64557.1 MAG: signal peptidase I [Gammaproteobacteria bacterium TMED281]
MLLVSLTLIFFAASITSLLDYVYLRSNYPAISESIRSLVSQTVVISLVLIIANVINVDWALLSVAIYAIIFKFIDDRYIIPNQKTDKNKKKPTIKDPYLEIAQDLCWFLIILIIIRSFLIQPYRVPSGSLEPTVDTGDFIMVNQFAYGLKIPILHYELFSIGKPQRGDIALFYYPKDPKKIYVKRIIGLPGDHVVYQNKRLMINGKVMPREDLGWYNNVNQFGVPENVKLFKEDLIGKQHNILLKPFTPDYGQTNIIVPKGQYFVLGDNRDNSNDSRFWGTVPESSFIGKAFLVWLSWDANEWRVRWNRIGTML